MAGDIELRLSEVLAGLSHALDITEGQPRGHAERSCVIGMRLVGRSVSTMPPAPSTFYALLLKDAGCSSNASKVAALFGTDDAGRKEHPAADRHQQPLGGGRAPAAHRRARAIAPDQGPARRRGTQFGSDGARSLVSCAASGGPPWRERSGWARSRPARSSTWTSTGTAGGYPAGIAGDEISLAGRVLCVAQTTEVFWRLGGPAAACEIARRRRGTWFDPALVDALVAARARRRFWHALAAPVVAAPRAARSGPARRRRAA